jgi:hypothetical protein
MGEVRVFSYSVDMDIDAVEALLAGLIEALCESPQENDGGDDVRRIAEDLAALPIGERLVLPLDVETDDEGDPPRLVLVLHRSGPSDCTLLILSDDEDLVSEVTVLTRRLLAAPSRGQIASGD